MEKLKPCPFCGGEAEMDRHFFYIGSNTYGVECKHCGVKTHQFYISEEAAAKAWNRRAERSEEWEFTSKA